MPEALAKKKKQGPRCSVSAEAFGTHNKKEAFVAKVIEKSPEAKAAILEKIDSAFMFSGLDSKERAIVVDAMEEMNFAESQVVIQEGDEGDCLYVVANGQLKCTKIFKGNTEPTHLKTYGSGEAFGELALLYNAPRAATITAESHCLLYALDRQTFNHIVKDAAIRKRERYEAFLAKIPLLETVDAYERSQIAEAFKEVKFKAGEAIITQGEEGRDLFFLEDGKAYATKIFDESKEAGP